MPNKFEFDVLLVRDDVDKILMITDVVEFAFSGVYYFDGNWKLYMTTTGYNSHGDPIAINMKPCAKPCNMAHNDGPPSGDVSNLMQFDAKVTLANLADLYSITDSDLTITGSFTYTGSWATSLELYGYMGAIKIDAGQMPCPKPC